MPHTKAVTAVKDTLPGIIRDLRTSQGLTQFQFAKLLGTHEGLVSKWETGFYAPSMTYIRKMEKTFGVSIIERGEEVGSEKTYENKIKRFLVEQGAWFVKYWSGSSSDGHKYTKDGVPDILCCLDGKFLGIEVKAKTGKPSKLQLYHLREIDQSGGYAILLYPDDWELFKNLVRCIKSDPANARVNYNLIKKRWWSKDVQ